MSIITLNKSFFDNYTKMNGGDRLEQDALIQKAWQQQHNHDPKLIQLTEDMIQFKENYSDLEHIKSMICLLKLLKDCDGFEVKVLKAFKTLLSVNKENAFMFFSSMQEHLNPSLINREMLLELIQLSLKNEDTRLAESLLSLEPDETLFREVSISIPQLFDLSIESLRNGHESIFLMILKIYPFLKSNRNGTGWESSTLLRMGIEQKLPAQAIEIMLRNEVVVESSDVRAAVWLSSLEVVDVIVRYSKATIDCIPAFFAACSDGKKDMVNLFLNHDVIKSQTSNKSGSLPVQEAQKHGHYDIADQLLDRFGIDQFRPLFKEYSSFLQKIHGLSSEEDFMKLAQFEMERVRKSRKGYCFDKGMLSFFSKEYAEGQARSGYTNFLEEQRQVFDQMKQDERMKKFPQQEIWRFAIDAERENEGPYVFENEPGYMKSFLLGMNFALQTRKNRKTAAWYIELHKQIVSKAYKLDSMYGQWRPEARSYYGIQTGLRSASCGFSIEGLDIDPLGIEDLKTRKGSKSYRYIESSKEITYGSPSNLEERLESLMIRQDQLLSQAKTRAEKLMYFLWTVRELEVEHFFEDANGRASYLALFSMVAGEEDLPMFLLPDPNVFDGNGPESLAYRYLEACVNFRKGGIGHEFSKSKEVKKLDSLQLDDSDLIDLRDELKALVEGKNWRDLVPNL